MIRKVRLEDAAAISGIYNFYVHETACIMDINPKNEDAFKEEIAGRLGQNLPFFVAEADGAVVGYAYGQSWSTRGACRRTISLSVFVDKNHLDKGYGKSLLNELVAACKSAGYHALMASVAEDNQAASAMLEGCGFVKKTHFHAIWEKFGKRWDSLDYQLLCND